MGTVESNRVRNNQGNVRGTNEETSNKRNECGKNKREGTRSYPGAQVMHRVGRVYVVGAECVVNAGCGNRTQGWCACVVGAGSAQNGCGRTTMYR